MKLSTKVFKVEHQTEKAILVELHCKKFWLPISRIQIKDDVLTIDGWPSWNLKDLNAYGKLLKFPKLVEYYKRNRIAL